MEQALRIVGRRRDHDPQSGEMGKQGIIIPGMMGRRRMSDADAAAEQDRHFEPPAAHVLHLGDLVQDFAERVEDEVGKHEVDHRPGADHRRPAAESDETAFADGRVAEPIGTEAVKQSESRAEVAPPFADPLPHHEDRRVLFHLEGERFEGRLHPSRFAARLFRRRSLLRFAPRG